MKQPLIAIAAILLLATNLLAELTLAPIFCDGMVLQRDMPAAIWGTSDPGDTVTVTFAGQTQSAVADSDGKWTVTLAPMEANSEGRKLGIHSASTTDHPHIQDVLVGEVWLCSGQSNMAQLLGANPREGASDNFPLIRQFASTRRGKQQEDEPHKWERAIPAERAQFTRTGYYFARRLHQDLDVPVGIIKAAVSGTPIEMWTPREALESDEVIGPIMEAQLAAAKAKQTDSTPQLILRNPGGLFRGHIAPLAPLAFRGVTWYQGEANARTAAFAQHYGRLLPLMIEAWRKQCQRDDLPFFFVQLPSIKDAKRAYPLVREAMLHTVKTVPYTGMAISIDVNEGLHPRSKHIMGDRLARLALRDVYGKDIVASGPLFACAELEDTHVVCRFTEIGSGLVCKGEQLAHFELAGADGEYTAAKATIEGDTVLVRSEDVPSPTAVRYAWGNEVSEITLFNKEGIPASPFIEELE